MTYFSSAALFPQVMAHLGSDPAGTQRKRVHLAHKTPRPHLASKVQGLLIQRNLCLKVPEYMGEEARATNVFRDPSHKIWLVAELANKCKFFSSMHFLLPRSCSTCFLALVFRFICRHLTIKEICRHA